MEFALQYEIQRSRPHYPGFMYDIYHQATEQVKLADRLGYHSVWTVEHHFLSEWSYSSAPEVWYGALSQVTSRIRLGHGICLLPIPFNHPARVAERIAVLDIMSNGRVEFGSGRSITEQELGGFQVNPEDSRAMWEEAVAAIPKMWMNETFSHDGKFFSMPEREVIPKPIQKPHPPIWFGARDEVALRRTVRHGDGWMGAGSSSKADFIAQSTMLRRLLEAARRDPAKFPISKRVYLAIDDNRERAERRLREWFGARYKNADLAPRVAIWGGVAEVVDKLGELVRAGAHHFLLNPVFDDLEHLDKLASEVMPHL